MQQKFSPIVALAFLVTFGLAALLTVRFQAVKTADRFVIPPPEYIEYFHFGFNESMADSFWLRWVQDVDLCMTYGGKAKAAAPIPEDQRDPLLYTPRYKMCDNSWGFKMLDTITKLAPRFMMPYIAGATTLSVLIEDYEGASVIFDRGLKVYPEDWTLSYRAAYHFTYDRGDVAKAAILLERAASLGGPIWLKSLASRMYTRAGQVELGLSVLENYRQLVEGNKVAEKEVDQRIQELRRKLKEP